MNEQHLRRIIEERLENGRRLRESTTLIKCRAIVEFDNGSNWQDMLAHIPPDGINSEGYVEEVWIAPEDMSIDETVVNGKLHFLLHTGWLVDLNIAKIDRFVVSDQELGLLPGSKLVVKYRIDNYELAENHERHMSIRPR